MTKKISGKKVDEFDEAEEIESRIANETELDFYAMAVPEEYKQYGGSLFGLAVGDAIGTTLEYKSPGTFEPIDDMVGGGPYNLVPGEWTDDTSMALCLAESLIQCRGFDLKDQLSRYLRWYKEGYLSSTGECFDIGNTVRKAIMRFERTGNPYSGLTDEDSQGNGSLMRLAPVPLFYAMDPKEGIIKSGSSSRTTHDTIECIDACRYMGGIIIGAVHGTDKAELLSDGYCPVKNYWSDKPLCPKIAEIASGSFKIKEPPEIEGKGYVVKSLEAALWAFHNSDSFSDGVLKAVNLGDDADTTGAIFGQIAGAYYGIESIPSRWISKLAKRGLIEQYAAVLLGVSRGFLR